MRSTSLATTQRSAARRAQRRRREGAAPGRSSAWEAYDRLENLLGPQHAYAVVVVVEGHRLPTESALHFRQAQNEFRNSGGKLNALWLMKRYDISRQTAYRWLWAFRRGRGAARS